MAASVVNVTIQGSGPYGFRLSGGNGEPMTIIKLRRQGKAHQAGLHEGDTVLGINGFSSRTMDHSAAMGLLESAIHSVELVVFRGQPEELNSAFDEVTSRLRPLPAGAAPPPRVLPPPPSGDAGALVIDQPSFVRPYAERFIVEERPPVAAPLLNGHSNMEDHDGTSNRTVVWQPSGPRQPWASSFDPSEAIATVPVDPAPATGEWSTGLWQNAPSQTPARWTPHQPLIAADVGDSDEQDFHVSAAPSTDPKRPWMWKPPVTFQVQATTVVAAPEPPVAEPQQAPHRDERDRAAQQQQQQQQQRKHNDEIDGVPKWALPLRSDYDWKKSYPWLADEHIFAEDDEWEYGYTSDGELVKRKKKIFADSSFYDDPNQKYPTIEEQIKMARRVAQSLTAATNVSARGQRMFLRRREKADRWIISDLPPPTMAVLLRRGLAGVREEDQVPISSRNDPFADSDSEMLYYNPAPWLKATGSRGGGGKPAPEVKTPTSGARLPWKTDFDLSSPAATAAFRQSSPPPAPPLGQALKWKPYGSSTAEPEVSGRGGAKDVPVPKFAAPGASAFNVSKELRQMKGKGGKMFAKRRAQAAEDERQNDLAETLRARQTRKLGGDEDWTDSSPTIGNVEADVSGNGWHQDQPASGQPHRLLELIERTRASSPGRQWTTSSVVVEQTHVRDPLSFGTFSAEVKSRGNFRPVRFKAPFGGADQYQAIAPTYSAPDPTTEGISDF